MISCVKESAGFRGVRIARDAENARDRKLPGLMKQEVLYLGMKYLASKVRALFVRS